MKLLSVASLALFAAVGIAKSGGQTIRVFILPSQSAEANQRLRIPYLKLLTTEKEKVEVEFQRSLGKLVGDTYSTGFRKVELPKCTLYLHKDARNMDELRKLLSLLKSVAGQSGTGLPELEFKNLPRDVKFALANALEVSSESINGTARCALQPEANFSYQYMGQERSMNFPWTMFDNKVMLKLRNSPKEAFVKPELAKEKAPQRPLSAINQSGFELLVEPGTGGQAERDALDRSVKYLNDQYGALEDEYNTIESQLKDRLSAETFGRGLSPDNFQLKNLEDLSKHERNHGQGNELIFHDPFLSAAESEAVRRAQFQGLGLCLSLSVMRSEHNGSNATVHLTNPFIRP